MHYFYNNTYLDKLCITQFGLSIKAENSIGQFGTGLKYALAVILRGGGKVTITSGEDTYEFGHRETMLRGQPISIATVTHNGKTEDMPFNLSLGKNWEEWMAFRELICNAWDEGGDYTRSLDLASSHETFIAVDWFPFNDLDIQRYFRREFPEPFGESGFLRQFDNDELRGRIYYKGVLVAFEKSALFGYELKGENWMKRLTEDRTLSDLSMLFYHAAQLQYETSKAVTYWTKLQDGCRESQFHLDVPADQMPTLIPLYNSGKITASNFRRKLEEYKRSQPPTCRQPNPREQSVIDFCLNYLTKVKIEVKAEVLVFEAEEDRTYAQTDFSKIYINHHTFRKGRLAVMHSIIEEQVHIRSGARDESYEMQHAYLELITEILQEITGEYL